MASELLAANVFAPPKFNVEAISNKQQPLKVEGGCNFINILLARVRGQ